MTALRPHRPTRFIATALSLIFSLSLSMAWGNVACAQEDDWLDGLVDELETELEPPPAAGTDQPAWMDDPLGHLATLMDSVEQRLDREDTGEETQAEEARIVEDMDVLIALIEEQMRQQQQQASGMGPGGGNQPAPDSQLRERENDTGELVARERSGVMNPDLTQRERDQILQAQEDVFPAGYESLVEEYLLRLASDAPEIIPDDVPAP